MGRTPSREERTAKQQREYAEKFVGLSAQEKMDAASEQFTDKQRKFVLEYRRYNNASKAVRLTYDCKEEYAAQIGHDLLQLAHVKAYLEGWREQTAKRYQVTEERILEELAKVAYGSIGDFIKFDTAGEPYFDLSEADAEQLAGLGELQIETYWDKGEERPVKSMKLKLVPKLGALELLGKNRKMFTDKLEVQGQIDVASRIAAGRQRRLAAQKGLDHDNGTEGGRPGGRADDVGAGVGDVHPPRSRGRAAPGGAGEKPQGGGTRPRGSEAVGGLQQTAKERRRAALRGS
jgi:phage terminase small subunit